MPTAEPLRCDYCGRIVDFPYKCKRCSGVFCVECHLPEEHRCPALRRGQLFLSFKKEKKSCCDYCGKTDFLFECRYCGGRFCAEHHLPPSHECVNLERWKARPPPGITTRYKVIGGGAPRAVSVSSVDIPVGREASSARATATSFSAKEERSTPITAPASLSPSPHPPALTPSSREEERGVRVKVEEPDKGENSFVVLPAMLLWISSFSFSLAVICGLTRALDLPHVLVAAAVATYVVKRFYDSERKRR